MKIIRHKFTDEYLQEDGEDSVLHKTKCGEWIDAQDAVATEMFFDDDDIEEWLQDYDEAGWILGIDLGLFSDLTSGAVRQLDSEMISMFELLSARITKLETKENINEPAK